MMEGKGGGFSGFDLPVQLAQESGSKAFKDSQVGGTLRGALWKSGKGKLGRVHHGARIDDVTFPGVGI